jgi:uroporphyrinogen decarboxylase
MPVNCRERVIATLNHKEPDRIPLDLGGTIVSSITKNAYIGLKKYLGLEIGKVKILDHVQQLPYIDEKLQQGYRAAIFQGRRLLLLLRQMGSKALYA